MTRRAQAIALVDMLNSATMVFSDKAKQREYEITLTEAALAEYAKAAPVSDVGALVERLRAVARAAAKIRQHADAALYNEAAGALLSAREEAVQWFEYMGQNARAAIANMARAEAAESKLADAVGVLEPFAAIAGRFDPPEQDYDCALWGETSVTLGMIRRARDFLTSIDETGR